MPEHRPEGAARRGQQLVCPQRPGLRGAGDDLEFDMAARSIATLSISFGLVNCRCACTPPSKVPRQYGSTKLSKTRPDELPMTGLQIASIGADVAVNDRDGASNPDTGQLLMDFDVAPAGMELAFVQRSPTASIPMQEATADAWSDGGGHRGGGYG